MLPDKATRDAWAEKARGERNAPKTHAVTAAAAAACSALWHSGIPDGPDAFDRAMGWIFLGAALAFLLQMVIAIADRRASG
jgi:hypothetical protein